MKPTSDLARIADISNTGRSAIIRAGFIAKYSNTTTREHATSSSRSESMPHPPSTGSEGQG